MGVGLLIGYPISNGHKGQPWKQIYVQHCVCVVCVYAIMYDKMCAFIHIYAHK